jgi:hypothetical protein
MKALTAAIAMTALAALTGTVEAQDNFLDVYVAKVKPEKRADFDAVTRKIVEANRTNHGDSWITFQTEYGENNTV